MSPALKFLLAARRSEILSLEQLAVTCDLVARCARLIHALQRERGVAGVYLVSQGERFESRHEACVEDSAAEEQATREVFDLLETESGQASGRARLFNRMATVLHGLESLPDVRDRTVSLNASSEEVAETYSRLISGLLAVVFEAADSAGDPGISRALVALFNFMQGKELAAQERGISAAGFAMGHFDADRQDRLVHLIEAQQRCFDTFANFSDPAMLALWDEALPVAEQTRFERLRRVAVSNAQHRPSADEESWFELATRRIDAMKHIESRMTAELLRLSVRKTKDAHADLEDHEALLATSRNASGGVLLTCTSFETEAMNPYLGRSILDLVREQSTRLQEMSSELARVQTALSERKLIERAKGMLMEHRGMTEDQAYRMLRQTAMDRGKRLAEVAETVIGLADFLSGGNEK